MPLPLVFSEEILLKENRHVTDKKVNIMVALGLLGAAVLVGIDQLTKWLVACSPWKMSLHESIHLIRIGDVQVLNLSYYLNDGSAFSMFGGKTEMLICVTSLMMGAMLCAMVLKKVKTLPYIISFSLIIAGGVGNLIDRIFNNGLVVDFIDVRMINFAIFNFADICAVCGGILLCVLVILDEAAERRAAKESNTVTADTDTDAEENDDGND